MEMQAWMGLLRRRWWIIVAAFVVGAGGAFSIAHSTAKTYRATARLYVSIPAKNVTEAAQGVQLTTQLLASYTKVIASQSTTQLVSTAINNRLSPSAVRGTISASVVPETVLIDVHADQPTPAQATQLANAAATSLATVIGDLDKTSGGVTAQVIDQAREPTAPTSPRPKRDITLGALLGLLTGFALALALDSLDRSIKSPTQAASAFGVPVIGSVPRQRRLADDPLVATRTAGSPMGEAYRALRTAVRFRKMGKPLETLLVTSPAAGDGKTTVAANLAIAISQDGNKVILIDGDLRRTRLGSIFGVDESAPGLTSVLLGRATLAEALQPWSGTLSILQTGPTMVYPSEALGSQAMRALLDEARRIADVVIIDAPPVLPVTDPVVLSTIVDGTIIVCRWGRTSMHAAEATRNALDASASGAEVIGVVLNAEGGGRSSNYYRHYNTRPSHLTRPAKAARNGAPAVPPRDREQSPTDASRG